MSGSESTLRASTPESGTRAARPRYPRGPEHAGTVGGEERLLRKLAQARWERDRWRRRHHLVVRRLHDLERRQAWTEGYVGFRVEYRLRGVWRRLRRYVRIFWRWLGG